MELYMNAKDVAKAVKLSVQTIRRYVMQKEIPFHKINRAVRFRPSEIENWIEARNNNSTKKEPKKQGAALFDGIENSEGATVPGGETVSEA